MLILYPEIFLTLIYTHIFILLFCPDFYLDQTLQWKSHINKIKLASKELN